MQYNANGLGVLAKQRIVSEKMKEQYIDIGSFQELKLGGNQTIPLLGFDNDMRLRSTKGGGVMNSVRHTGQLHKRQITHRIPEELQSDIEAITT